MEIQRQNDFMSSEWCSGQFCETDRLIVGKKHDDVQSLLNRYMVEEEGDSIEVINLDELDLQSTNTRSTTSLTWNLENPLTGSFCEELCSETSDGQFVKIQSDEENVQSLRTVMEHEVVDLGVPRLERMICSFCSSYFSTSELFLYVSPENVRQTRCHNCWEDRPRAAVSLFDILKVEIAEKWSKMVSRRVESIYGESDPKIAEMVKMLKENVLQADEISQLLKGCTDVGDFKGACEVIIMTTMIFYLVYMDFLRSCDTLINIKPSVTYSQLFEIFEIYFPNRAKGIRTGDLL